MDLIARTGENDKAPYGSMQKVLDRYSTYELSRSQVQKRVERIKVQASRWSLFLPIATTNPLPPPVAEIRINSELIGGSPNSVLTSPSKGRSSSDSGGGRSSLDRAKGGRPIGSTQEAKQQKNSNIIKAIKEASKGQQEERSGGKKGRSNFTRLLRTVEKAHNLDDNELDRHKFTIRKRAERKNPSGRSESQMSPMEAVEPTIVAYCIKCMRYYTERKGSDKRYQSSGMGDVRKLFEHVRNCLRHDGEGWCCKETSRSSLV
jgi:hypothetical protein